MALRGKFLFVLTAKLNPQTERFGVAVAVQDCVSIFF